MPTSDTSITVDGLGKRYRLGGLQPYRTLRDTIVNLVRPGREAEQPRKEFWALKDVSFDVKRGEVLGIIGRNGAGKSTLLKLLCRITTPDTGRIELDGRVGALLEVGTGFHPELTGRENIYLNGSILGMSRRDIDRKFDEIVAFSGVETFLDTPVKRYSSGMRVRLGFAVAAHLEPEILVIDEVLAVGDAEFQRKCLGRMNEVAGEGRTVLFVSHQMEAIQSLCTRAIWLQDGTVALTGSVADVVKGYLSESLSSSRGIALRDRKDRSGEGKIRVVSVGVHDGAGYPVITGGKLTIDLVLEAVEAIHESLSLYIRIGIFDQNEHLLTMIANELSGDELRFEGKQISVQCEVPRAPLVPGQYILNFAVRTQGVLQDKMFPAKYFEINAGNYFLGRRNEHAGVFHMDQYWRLVS
jgi:lipopolysaccharide transport system ATP-binding protein